MAKRRPRTMEWPDTLRDLPKWVEASAEFAPIAKALAAGRAATIDGAWKSAASLSAATLLGRCPKTLLIVLAHPRELDNWAEDLVSFTGERAHVFPAWDQLPGAETVIDDIGGSRLRMLRQLEGDSPPKLLL